MKAARLVQWILLAVASLGFLLLVLVFADRAFDTPDSVPTPVDGYGWAEVLAELPSAAGPADYRDLPFGNTAPTEEDMRFFSRSNGFVASSGVLMILGLLGYATMIAALARRPSGRFAPLAVLGAGGAVLLAYWLVGFNTAYPIDTILDGVLPAAIGGPLMEPHFTGDDVFDYGLAFTIWTDFFYQAIYAVSCGTFVIGLLAGSYRTPMVVLAAIAAGAFAFPLASMWLWGGGWLMNLGAVDFAGSGIVHLTAGGVGLALVALARLCPPLAPWQIHAAHGADLARRDPPPRSLNPPALLAFLAGTTLFLLLPLGMQAGSVLSVDVPVVAKVLHNTLLAILAATAAAALLALRLAARPRPVILVLGALAGVVAVAGSGDMLSSVQSLVLGLVAGSLAALLLWLGDRHGVDDPLGIVAVHFTGGAIGLIAAGVVDPGVPLVAQLVAAASYAILGLALGACLGLLGWMLGLLWTPGGRSTPPAAATPN